MSKDKIILNVENLTKKFKNNIVLDDVSFEVRENEILGILGFSGEGKSTLLNIICGFISYDKGSIEYDFTNSKKRKIIPKEIIGYSTQEPSFYEEMTVYENIFYFGELLNVNKKVLKVRTEEILNALKLKNVEGKLGCNLSVGMKKRLDLACSLIHEPKILILDEPTANLDFSLREEFLNYVKKINKMGVSIIYVSHFVEEIEDISDRVLFLNDGKLKIVDKNKNLKEGFLKFVEEVKLENEKLKKEKEHHLEKVKHEKNKKKKEEIKKNSVTQENKNNPNNESSEVSDKDSYSELENKILGGKK